MPFKTPLNSDILNIVCEYSGIDPTFYYYKQVKKSKEGFRDVKLHYKCMKCNKCIRNLKTATYGFFLNIYEYYDADITEYYFCKDGISKFYHSKFRTIRSDDIRVTTRNEELRVRLDRTKGELNETRPYHFILKMRNVWDDGKILGKLIIKTMNSLNNIFDRFNKERRRLERCGINVELEMIGKNDYMGNIKKSILDNNKNVDLGYYCSMCSKDTMFGSFINF